MKIIRVMSALGIAIVYAVTIPIGFLAHQVFGGLSRGWELVEDVDGWIAGNRF